MSMYGAGVGSVWTVGVEVVDGWERLGAVALATCPLGGLTEARGLRMLEPASSNVAGDAVAATLKSEGKRGCGACKE